MKLNYLMIPENVTRRPRHGLGHRRRVLSPISRAGRRAPGEAKGEPTAPAKTKGHWDNIASRIGAFLKGVVPQTTAAASTRPKDLFNTESLFSKFSRKSAFHRHLLHPDEEPPIVPSRTDTFYLPPSPRTPTVPRSVRRVTSSTRDIKIGRSLDNGRRLNMELVPDRNIADCVGKIDVSSPGSPHYSTALSKARRLGCSLQSGTPIGDNGRFNFSPQEASILGQRLRPTSSALDMPGSSRSSCSSTPAGDNSAFVFSPQDASILGQRLRPASFVTDKTGSSGSSHNSTPIGGVTTFAFSPQSASILGQRLKPDFTESVNGTSWKHHGDSSEYRNISVHQQRQSFPSSDEVHIHKYQTTSSPQFFDYDSRLEPPIQPSTIDNSPRVQEYTPHEPYFNQTFCQHASIHGWSAAQNIHSIYPYQVPYSYTLWSNHHSPLEYSPHQPYFIHY